MNKLKATFVLTWFGPQIPGGAEAEALRTAQNLAQAGVQVQVLTTCLGGLGTDWDVNVYPPGLSLEAGLTVRRFPIAPRDGGLFNRFNAQIMAGELLSEQEEELFFKNMIYSPELFDYIAAHPEDGPFFFIPYLFTSAVWGPLIHPQKSVIIPCLHDEGYARLQSVRKAFENARAIAFHVPAERNLAFSLYDLDARSSLILGEGIDADWTADGGRFREKYKISFPFILYAGRKDQGKNVPLLIHYFLRYLQDHPEQNNLKLITIGNLKAPIPPGGEKHVLDLGFVDKQDKYDAYAAADILFQPSIMESFSIVIMEAWLAGTPVVVHSACAVTREHVEQSGGGLHFADYPHFAEILDMLLADPQLRNAMAQSGREYVLSNYSWDKVTERYVELIKDLSRDAPEAEPQPAAVARQAADSAQPAVHQLVPDFAYGDAIGSEALAIRKYLRSLGLQSEIFSANQDQRLGNTARPWPEYARQAKAHDLAICHFSVGHKAWSDPQSLPGRKILRYHNITPAHFFELLLPEAADRCVLGRNQLRHMCQAVEAGWGVSLYNCAELLEAGCPNVQELPILLDTSIWQTPPDPLIMARFQYSSPAILHVGRLAPNKKLEDLIKTHYWLTKIHPDVRLFLVGSDGTCPSYAHGLKQLVRDLKVPNVHFSGHVSLAAVMAYYHSADFYLCLSEHEGFCVPLVEAMHFGLPIVAFNSTGISGTLGSGGILLDDKDPVVIAELLAYLIDNPEEQNKWKQAGRTRLEHFQPHRIRAKIRDFLTGMGVKCGA